MILHCSSNKLRAALVAHVLQSGKRSCTVLDISDSAITLMTGKHLKHSLAYFNSFAKYSYLLKSWGISSKNHTSPKTRFRTLKFLIPNNNVQPTSDLGISFHGGHLWLTHRNRASKHNANSDHAACVGSDDKGNICTCSVQMSFSLCISCLLLFGCTSGARAYREPAACLC